MKPVIWVALPALVILHSSQLLANPVHKLLLSAETFVMVAPRQEIRQVVQTAEPDTPLLDRVELRTETDDFDLSRQQYSLRIYPTTRRESKTARALHNALMASKQVELELLIHQELIRRYQLLVDMVLTAESLKLEQRLSAVYDDRVQVIRQKIPVSTRPEADIDDLLSTERDQSQLKLELIQSKADLDGLSERLQELLGPDEAFAAEDGQLIDLAGMVALIRQDMSVSGQDNIYLRGGLAQVQLAENQYQLETQERKGLLRFFEVSYDQQFHGDPNRAYSIGLGLRLPFGDSNRMSVNRRHLRHLEEKSDFHQLKADLEAQSSTVKREVMKLMAQYSMIAEDILRGSSASVLEAYRGIEGNDPLILLNFEENSIRNRIDQAELKHSIYAAYIRWLDLAGIASQKPLKNYLSQDLETVTQ